MNGEVKLGIRYFNVLISCLQFSIISQVVEIAYLLQNFKKSIIQNRDVDKTAPDKGRPCRVEVRWYGATDSGLRDVRDNVRLWGMKSEIDLHAKLSSMDEHKNKTSVEISELVLSERLDLKKRKELYMSVHGEEYEGDL